MCKKIIYKYYAEITGFLVFLVYISTLSPTISEFDSGELAAVQATLGIAHPTGYPLFSLLGYLWYHILIPLETIYALNLLNSVWCALSVVIIIKITFIVLVNNFSLAAQNNQLIKPDKLNSKNWYIISSIFAGLTLAFSVTFWIQSSKIEVYSLQTFLFAIIIYQTLKAYLSCGKGNGIKSVLSEWWKVFLFIGISFSNHMMTIFILPGVILLYFIKNRIKGKVLVSLIILGFFSLSIAAFFYLSMMFYSSLYPAKAYMYGAPSNFKILTEYITGSYFQHFLKNGQETFYKQFLVFVAGLSFNFKRDTFISGQFSFAIIFIVIGFIFSILFFRKFFLFAIISIICTLIVALNYGIPDIQEYFLLSFLFFAVFAGIAVNYLFLLFNNKMLKISLVFLLLLSTTSQLIFNYKGVDRSDRYFFYDYPYAILKKLESNSILYTKCWDGIASPSLYLQEHLNIRKDIFVVEKNMLLFPRYKLDLKNRFSSFDEARSELNFYITNEVYIEDVNTVNFKLNKGEIIIPDVLCFRIVKDSSYYSAADPDFKIRVPYQINTLESKLIASIPYILEKRCDYEISYNKIERAKLYYQKILDDFPNYLISQETMQKMKNYK